jgi:ATP-dependent helicase/nuclease subunit A
MKAAERMPGCGPFREIPFSITEPVSPEDFRLIQGMIDCWFIEDGRAVLVDYKSDRIRGDLAEKERVLRERYAIQLDYYARAIEAASRLKVKERMIWLIPEATSFVF